ncbi:MAG: protein kinase [Thermoanaerobaculia bacterium]|nr:protein kinase [Thermoanaerobaculia bacterium]
MATILVIDDDPDALLLVDAALTRAGHRVVTSSDARDITELTAEHGADAVVLDVLMPEMSGHDALQALRNRATTGGVPVLLLSAQAEGQDRVKGLRQGADDFLGKPFEPEELVLRIERLVAQPARGSAGPELNGAQLQQAQREGKVEGTLYLGRYQALEVVGEGGSGLVFRGWDPWLKRPVALKTLRFDQLEVGAGMLARARNADSASRQVADLLHEAVTVARFTHANIVTLFDVGGARDYAFLAMEFVDGMSLAEYLAAVGVLEPGEALHLGLAISAGLEVAHRERIVHQDVKPGNILLGRDGSIKVSDFGVAQLIASLNEEEETIFGTPGYLPPEVLLGETYSERADLFGLGVVLFQALTGMLPYTGKNPQQRLLATVHGEMTSARDAAPGISEEFVQLLADLLAREPKRRPASAAEVIVRLRALPEAPGIWHPNVFGVRERPFRSAATSRVMAPSDLAAFRG